MAYDKVVDSTKLDAGLTEVANAIRAKGGTTGQLAFPAGFKAAVEALPAGGADGIKIIKQNLIDMSQIIENKYYDRGVLTAYNNWSATQLIPIEAEVVYAISSMIGSTISVAYTPLFNANKDFDRDVGTKGGFMSPSGTSYVLWKSPITGYIAFSAASITISALKMYRCVGSLIEVE
uniref:Uncharacterized protein n=1 Tax=Myoviridae sp. ct4uh47 TaxID=2825032 RepID=A0A8S5V699_9CAUD|nr:MAG TPA: hypothetical protein [Myoviridae sp. ct4uh47]